MKLTSLGNWIAVHKKTSTIIILVLLLGGYATVKSFTKDAEPTKYVLAKAQRTTLVSSVTGTGQVSALNQVDVKSKASGDLVYLNAVSGQEVAAGALLAQLDASDAQYDLESAKISYEDLVNTDPDDLRKAQNTITESKKDVVDAYRNALATLTSSAVDMSEIIDSLNELFLKEGYLSLQRYNLTTLEKTYRDKAGNSFYTAQDMLKEYVAKQRLISNAETNDSIKSLLDDAEKVSQSIVLATKYSQDAVAYLRDRENREQTIADDAYTLVTTLVSDANATLASVSSAKKSIDTSENSLEDAEIALNDLKDGPDTSDIRSAELSVKQKQQAVNDYYIRAPFDGVVASVAVKKGETLSSNTTIATIITKQKIAEISLNEIDAAKIKVGQKATLTFDAFEDLKIKGEVTEVDLVGTVSQGVVNYKVKINFASDDNRIKPGMTASADIVTESKEGIVSVPASAVKTFGNMSFVEVVDQSIPQENRRQMAAVELTAPPRRVPVKTGLTNDESVEITDGLNEGDTYIVRTVTATGATPTTRAPSLFGGGAGGGNAARRNFAR